MRVLNVDENIQDKGEFMFTFKNGNTINRNAVLLAANMHTLSPHSVPEYRR